MAEAEKRPVLFKYGPIGWSDGPGITVLSDVCAILCGSVNGEKFCHVELRSGSSAIVPVELSNALIRAMQLHHEGEVLTSPSGDDPARQEDPA